MKQLQESLSYILYFMLEMIIPRNIVAYNSSFTGKFQKPEKSIFGNNFPAHKKQKEIKRYNFLFARKK